MMIIVIITLIQVCAGGQGKDGGGSLEGSTRDLSKLELNINDSKNNNNNNKTLKNMTRFTIGKICYPDKVE